MEIYLADFSPRKGTFADNLRYSLCLDVTLMVIMIIVVMTMRIVMVTMRIVEMTIMMVMTSKPLEIRFVLLLLPFSFVTNLQNQTRSDMFSSGMLACWHVGSMLACRLVIDFP